ncbi:MAG: NUDIX domain-containing protein [Halobacteriales archaeon]|nr:NUDIX domain-containing protein [Halobacteriales archaeon]
MGKRENEPAKGEWFVPGGTVLKNERLTEAVHRVAREELDCTVDIVESLGVFEHFYDTSEISGIDSKHYVANGFVVRPESEPTVADDQHGAFRVVSEPYPELHPYVKRYLDAIEVSVSSRNCRRDFDLVNHSKLNNNIGPHYSYSTAAPFGRRSLP